MTDKNTPSKDYQNINPDDFFNYEEGFVKKSGGGGSGAKSVKRKGKKTIKALKKQQSAQSLEQRRIDVETTLKQVLKRFPAIDNPDLKEKQIDCYVTWIENNIRELTPLDSSEINITFSKSSGPGGQNINKRETRVTLIHQPTNLNVVSDRTRSQLQNKNLALELLQVRLQEHLNDWKKYLAPGQIVDVELVKMLLD